jgi:hypothetical protein
MPYRLMVAEPTSASSGKLMLYRLLNAARISTES